MKGKSVNVLVLGGGGREHALCWKLGQSPLVKAIYCAGGAGGIAQHAQCMPPFASHTALIEFCHTKSIHLVIPGSETMLLDGVVDALTQAGIAAFGPHKAAAMLEGSKGFTKDLCRRCDIPTAAYRRFDEVGAARRWARRHGAPLVVKADGLAAGKGVIMARTLPEALGAIDAMFDGRFGAAGTRIVLEDWLEGQEMSFFAICDSTTALPFMTAQDYKRIGEGDTGANTGGMGAVCPSPCATAAVEDAIMTRIITPTLHAMADAGTPFRGVLYAGLMLCATGPHLIEYNVRFGDPECQAMLPRLRSDLLPILLSATREQTLDTLPPLEWHDNKSVLVVVASQGYPQAYEKDTPIDGVDSVARQLTCLFHAGTRRDDTGQWRATGGRVLNAVACKKSLSAARTNVYTALEQLDWPKGYYRRDIGLAHSKI